HHDLQADVGHFAPANFLDFGFDQAIVDTTFVAFRAGNRDFAAVIQYIGGVCATHHGGDAQFTRNDGRVASAPAAVGDDGGGQFHDGFPVRVGHVGDEDIASLDFIHFRGIGHDTHLA